ncbi:hypothetical protein R1sor_021037 [Riccia sorocarpa]|uniref:Protein prenyltransferase alpha subunit repeat-containing protein 1 n=1 Tax=Riccia sorocarpa TaxID=122646 RepID=A0ABD3GHD2_9MARC
MDGSEDDNATRGRILLADLDLIFINDPLIDELGYVHPSQLVSLHSDGAASKSPFSEKTPRSSFIPSDSSNSGDEPHAGADCPRKSEHRVGLMEELDGISFDEGQVQNAVLYDRTAFWSAEHKLAISVPALAPLYKSAREAFTLGSAEYKNLYKAEEATFSNASGALEADNQHHGNGSLMLNKDKRALEDSLMTCTRALVLVNCDHATAWNMRKRLVSKRANDWDFLVAELRLAGVVLSCAHKSEETWAHRRWVILQMINNGLSRMKLDVILENESKLVESVAERSPMNYRAWRHRCWLVAQMSFLQIAIELHRTKLWASFHVSDNCCFHYRRTLLTQLLQPKVPGKAESREVAATADEKEMDMRGLRVALFDGFETRALWQEEVDWTKKLINRYLGREALWLHLRFLFYYWMLHIKRAVSCSQRVSLSGGNEVSEEIDRKCESKSTFLSADTEREFVSVCIAACNSNLTEEANKQRELAASYKLWVLMKGLKQQKEESLPEDTSLSIPVSDERESTRMLLNDVAPHRSHLWEGIISGVSIPQF